MAHGVQFVTNAGNLAVKKRILAGKAQENFRRAAQAQAAQMRFVAQSLSSGPLSSAQLRQMGHPYSTRLPAGAAGQPDFVINRQSGLFYASWVCRAQKNGNDWTISLYNTAPYARYMMGTGTMRARLILGEVARKTSPMLAVSARRVMTSAARMNGGTAPVGGTFLGGVLYAVGVGVSSAAGAIEGAL